MQLAFDESESLDLCMFVVKVVAKHEQTAGSGRDLEGDRTPQQRLPKAYLILARNILKRG